MKTPLPRLSFLVAAAAISLAQAAVTDDILALTGNRRTRIVWSREIGAVNHAYGIGGSFRLMRFDTDVGVEADVLGATGNFFRAKLTHGDRHGSGREVDGDPHGGAANRQVWRRNGQ